MEIERFLARPIPEGSGALLGVEVPDAVECGEALVDITDLHPRIRYAASYLEMGIEGAPSRCLVRSGVYERLCAALELLPVAYSFLIYDTLRPLAVQRALFEDYKGKLAAEHPELDEAELEERTSEFVARPVKDALRPSSHQTGGAVDLTLLKGGQAVDMGTEFDEFAPVAHAAHFERPGMDAAVRDNRRLLHNVMREAGFTHYEGEWWHFDYGDRQWAACLGCAPRYAYCCGDGG